MTQSIDEQRPSPEALLDQVNREGRGKLKVFMGAAPGVGKTYSMLRAAQARQKENIDVVIGLIETHQRSETDAMADGIPQVPRLSIDYRGIAFQEMDLDAVLARKPKLVLVDELAHSNIPGSRHPKRFQDVLELLDAGINVYTTLNVQHLESLNDIVARITGVTVRETIPDNILQRADSIELIDLTPEELLQRLKEGKVYIPEQARLAMNRFFTPGNLTALRELALRQAAARVDDQMASYMRSHAIVGPWPTSDRVLVCISNDGQAIPLIRTAKRSAERRQSPWLALYIETHRHAYLSTQERKEITQALHLAESLGGETMTVSSENIVDEVLRVARDRNVSVIITGKSQRSFWSRIIRPSVASAILNRGASFDILVMSGGKDIKRRPIMTDAGEAADLREKAKSIPWRSYLQATMAVMMSSALAWGISHIADIPTLSLIYLIGILLVAVDRGFIISMYATIFSFLSFDFLFVEPRFSLTIERHEDFLTLMVFVVIGLAIGYIGDRLQKQVAVTRSNADRTQALYDFNKTIAAVATLDDIMHAVVRHVAHNLHARVALLMPQDDHLQIRSSYPSDMRLDTASNAAMDWAWRHGKPAGFHSDTLPMAPFFGLPLRSSNQTVGILALLPENGEPLTPDQEIFLSSLANQSAVALERAMLAGDIAQARLQTETERLRSSLLSSISHDLRTPLVAILGATTSLRDYWDRFDDKSRSDLFATIEDESERLNRFVQNLLDMTQLVSGGLKLKRLPTDVQDLVGSALTKLRKQIGKRPLRLDIPEELPPLDGDFTILEHVLVNIIDNACKYAQADQPLTVAVQREAHYLRITVTDRGPGIPETERERVFDMFYRLKIGSTPSSGAGLGLAICRGFIEAHGGRIAAQTGPDGTGTQIVIRLKVVS